MTIFPLRTTPQSKLTGIPELFDYAGTAQGLQNGSHYNGKNGKCKTDFSNCSQALK